MKEVSIKKLCMFLLSFAIIAVAITTLLIAINNNKLPVNYISNEIIGTKKNQKYNQNDLEIVQENINYEGLEYLTVRISGLKNKDVENKINKELEEVEDEFRKKIVASTGENENMYISSFVTANYSNIFSVAFYGSKSDSNYVEQINIHKFLNYDLSTGNHIKLEEIFLPGTDIDLYAQNYIYKQKLLEKFLKKDVFIDPKCWQSEEFQYIADEIDEADFINEYMKYKNSNKDFYLSYDGVYIKYSDDVDSSMVYIDFTECIENLIVYNKFVTKDSIFEKDDIGLKDLYVCTSVVNYNENSKYLIKDVVSNFRIDARINILLNDEFADMQLFKDTLAKIEQEINEKKEEYTKIANANKNQYYFVGILYYIDDFDPNFYISSEYEKNTPKLYDKFLVEKQEKIYAVSMTDFSNWFEDKLIKNYRSDNYTMDYQIYINLSNEEKAKCSIKDDEISIVYNVNTNLITSDLSEIFEDGVDYINIINKCLKNEYSISREKVEKMINNHEYTISPYMIIFKSGDTEYSVDYSNFNFGDFK